MENSQKDGIDIEDYQRGVFGYLSKNPDKLHRFFHEHHIYRKVLSDEDYNSTTRIYTRMEGVVKQTNILYAFLGVAIGGLLIPFFKRKKTYPLGRLINSVLVGVGGHMTTSGYAVDYLGHDVLRELERIIRRNEYTFTEYLICLEAAHFFNLSEEEKIEMVRRDMTPEQFEEITRRYQINI